MKNKYIGDYYILLSLIRDLTNVRTFLNVFEWKFLEAICKHSGLTSNSQVTNRSPRCTVIGIVFDQWSLGVEAQRLWNGFHSSASAGWSTKYFPATILSNLDFFICFFFSELLWTAPELLRSGNVCGTKEADVYSFAIVCSELINNEVLWRDAKEERDVEGFIAIVLKIKLVIENKKFSNFTKFAKLIANTSISTKADNKRGNKPNFGSQKI